MKLHVLPVRNAGAAENMATDFLLLQRYPHPVARFRHYGWRTAAFTFGYAQKLAEVRAGLPADETLDLCRRPTGGGIVDHRNDWTYALVIPRGHPLEERRATESYRLVHEALATALGALGVPALVKPAAPPPDEDSTGICFQRAEIYDVVHGRTGAKIAGAAQKRNKRGLLFQGSIWRPATISPDLDWEAFHEGFCARLAAGLDGTAEVQPWPEFNEDELTALSEQYASPEWTGLR